MKKFKFDDDTRLTLEDIHACKTFIHHKEFCLMEKRMNEICDYISFKDYAQELIFKDAFLKGMIAANCFNNEDIELEQSLSPLGKALK